MFTYLAELAAHWLATGGYPALGVLMAFESMVIPIPSEAVMPFAGFLVAQGTWTWLAVALWSTAGSLVGSLVSYWIGAAVGRPVLLSWGRFVGLTSRHLEKTEQWFGRRGSWAIFICRFVPVVRHLISLPAGTARMPLLRFAAMTVAGAAMWNMFLTYVGFKLGENWTLLRGIGHWLDIIVGLALVVLVGWWYARRRRESGRLISDRNS